MPADDHNSNNKRERVMKPTRTVGEGYQALTFELWTKFITFRTSCRRMTSIDDLVALRQSSLDTFVVNGGKRRDVSYIGEQEAEPFVSDVALLTHPLYSIAIKYNATAIQRSLESTIAKLMNSRMITDAVHLSKVHYYGSRDNKYGTSFISFDNEGVLFACGGSNGIIKVYDFDECYASSCLRRDGVTVSPVVSFDTRRDVTCISWSHLRPDYVAVSYLFRPDIQVFDLTDAEDANCDPRQTLTADGKGRGGHNVLLYWHSVKCTPAPPSAGQEKGVGEQRHSEGVVAGSVTGFIRYWSSAGGSKSCAWNVMADPQRTSLTATPVVALQALHLAECFRDGAAVQLLLAATAQGVVTLWDLSDLRAASFGSVQPEPRCVRRIELTSQLLLYESRTLIGVTPTSYPFCSACSAKKRNNAENLRRQDSGTCSDTSCHNIDVLSCSQFCAKRARPSTPAPAPINHQVDSKVLLTVSQGSVFVLDLNTESVLLSSANSNGATYESAGAPPQQMSASRLQAGIDPTNPAVLSYEQLRQELVAAEQTSRDQGGHTLRAVLPAVVPAWNSHLHLQQFSLAESHPSQQGSTLLARLAEGGMSDRAAGDVAIVAVPRRGSGGTVLSAFDLTDSAPLHMFPNAHNLNGLCSVSGKDSDPYSGVVRSNMRRTDAAATTLPGFIMSAEPGSHEVVTSTDLQTYLCASVASGGGSVFAKSSELEFDWTLQGLDLLSPCLPGASSTGSSSSGALGVVQANGVPYLRTTSTNTVEGTSLHRLILRTPYVGPCVVDGLPRVYVRAALLPSGRTATFATSSGQGSSSAGTHRLLPLHENVAMTQAITALAAHPTYPILVAGTRTDDIVLINPCDPTCAEDLVQEQYSVAAAAAVGEGEECPVVSERESRAAAALKTRRTLHRVGKALPVSDTGIADGSGEIKTEISYADPSANSALDSALDAEMELDASAPLASGRSAVGDRTEESGDNKGDGDGESDDDCSLVQLREQYEVDASVLSEPQLHRVLLAAAATGGEGALCINSPLERARQQMLRARAKHQKADPASSFSQRDLDMPDIALFTGGREVSQEKSAEIGRQSSTGDDGDKSVDASALKPENTVSICSGSALSSGLTYVEQARTLPPSSIAAIHHTHHKRDSGGSSGSAEPREAKKPSLLHMFATGSSFPASKAPATTTHVAAARGNGLTKVPNNNLEAGGARGAAAGGSGRNTLSKLLAPKSAPPATTVEKGGASSGSHVAPPVLRKSTPETIRRPSIALAAPTDAPTIGKKRATDGTVQSAAAKVPTLQLAVTNTKPKSVSNILNFFSVNKK